MSRFAGIGQHLDGDRAVEPRIVRAIDLSHSAGADDLVRSEARPGDQSSLTSDPIVHTRHAARLGAVCATVVRALCFDAMSDDFALAVRADRRKQVHRAFEAVESVRFARHDDLKRLVVIIPADLELSHEASHLVDHEAGHERRFCGDPRLTSLPLH